MTPDSWCTESWIIWILNDDDPWLHDHDRNIPRRLRVQKSKVRAVSPQIPQWKHWHVYCATSGTSTKSTTIDDGPWRSWHEYQMWTYKHLNLSCQGTKTFCGLDAIACFMTLRLVLHLSETTRRIPSSCPSKKAQSLARYPCRGLPPSYIIPGHRGLHSV